MVSPKPLKLDIPKDTSLPETAYAFLSELISEFPQFNFIISSRFKWKYPKSIYIDAKTPTPPLYFYLQTLHELGHALSNHKDYKTDVRRLKMESEAWERARELIKTHENWTKTYDITYNEDFVEEQLDSYRDWLHQRSKCKICGLTRFQKKSGKWLCPKCDLIDNRS
ncbi:hypothetical protein IJF91_00820 [Candidatus Saccharibacteria bacterium]|nr:hypothetical protein [Candidatus Saccharibacteria bacterium]